MRICLLTSSYPRFEGDITGNFIRELCNELVRRGFNFEVVTPADKKRHRQLNDSGINVTRFNYILPHRLQRLAYGNGIEENLKRHWPLYLLLPLFMFFFLIRAWLVARRCDFIWSHWLLPAGVVGDIVARLLKKPRCITVHSAAPIGMLRYMRFLIRGSSQITAVSAKLQEQIIKISGEDSRRVHLIPMGIHLPSCHSLSDKTKLRGKYGFGSEFLILYMGRLIKIKGINTLIRAASGLEETLLIIAGEGPEKKKLIQLAESVNAPVRFEGFLTGEKKTDWLALCDIFVAPSLTLEGGRSEGLPVSVLEALAAGKPVVACPSGGIDAVITDDYNGFLVPSGDIESLSEKIQELKTDPALCNHMGENAIKSVSNYEIGIVAAKYEGVFNNCVGH